MKNSAGFRNMAIEINKCLAQGEYFSSKNSFNFFESFRLKLSSFLFFLQILQNIIRTKQTTSSHVHYYHFGLWYYYLVRVIRSDVLCFSSLCRACQLSIKTHLLFFYDHIKTWLAKIYTQFCLFLGAVMRVSKLSPVECEHMSCLSQGHVIFGLVSPVLLFISSWNQDILPIWPNPYIPWQGSA